MSGRCEVDGAGGVECFLRAVGNRTMMELRLDSGMAGMRLIVPRGGIGPGYDLVPGERIMHLEFPLLATLPGLESCEHDKDGFALWISVRPGHLLRGFCYQAAQVLAEDIRCAACGRPAGDPDRDCKVIARLAGDLGAHFYLCRACADTDLNQ